MAILNDDRHQSESRRRSKNSPFVSWVGYLIENGNHSVSGLGFFQDALKRDRRQGLAEERDTLMNSAWRQQTRNLIRSLGSNALKIRSRQTLKFKLRLACQDSPQDFAPRILERRPSRVGAIEPKRPRWTLGGVGAGPSANHLGFLRFLARRLPPYGLTGNLNGLELFCGRARLLFRLSLHRRRGQKLRAIDVRLSLLTEHAISPICALRSLPPERSRFAGAPYCVWLRR